VQHSTADDANPAAQIVRTPSGDEMVILPKRDYDALLEALEELEDVAAYDAAKEYLTSSDVPPYPTSLNALFGHGKRRVAVLREWRGLSVAELAAHSCLPTERIAEMEAGTQMQTAEEAAKLAGALNVHIGWVEP
jgi:Helix-turn-helix